MLAFILWILHGLVLWWRWGKYRPHIALLHGVGLALVAGLPAVLGVPPWVMYLLGGVIGGVGAWGHPLAPGLWVGIGLLWPVPFLLRSGPVLLAVVAFALTAQVVAAIVSWVAQIRQSG